MDIPILWEDAILLAANKPAGLRTIPDGYDPTLPHLHGLLSERYGHLWVVHRLDKDTSGVILFARNPEAHRILNGQFENRETRKEYHAIILGMPEWEELEINLPLRVNGDRKHRTVIDPVIGKPSSTFCRVLQRFSQFTLVSASPRTGYTHQIRAHLAAIGFPLAADPLYQSLKAGADRKSVPELPIQRTALHAFEFSFMHPGDSTLFRLQAPYPEDMRLTIQFLEGK